MVEKKNVSQYTQTKEDKYRQEKPIDANKYIIKGKVSRDGLSTEAICV
jgi:hypothetical protein